jgi:dipeptidyl-peptidase-4
MNKSGYMHTALAVALLFAGGTLSATAANASINVNAIAKYVYPENAVATPGKMAFMPDGESFLRLSDAGTKIVKYETATGKEIETVFDATHTREASINTVEDFSISPDGSKLLIYNARRSVYRRSFTAAYYVFEIKRNILRPLSKTFSAQQSPLFSPDSRMVAFVAENNIYIKKIDYDSEVQVTTDGKKDAVINGIADWTYEEEFEMTGAMTWSDDCSTLCYLRFNETDVPKFSFPLYEGWCEENSDYALYPGTFSYKYPVAGKPNSVVSVHSYDVDNRKIKEIPLADKNIEYIPRIAFGGTTDTSALMIVTLNRDQNRMEVYSANPKSTVSKSILVEQSSAWLNPSTYEAIDFSTDGFTVISDRKGISQAYKYSYNGQLLRQLTSSSHNVTAVYGEDAAGYTYYQAVPSADVIAAPTNAINRAVYRIDKTGKKLETLTTESGWASASFTGNLNYYIVNYSNATTPPVYTLYSNKARKLRELENNADYASRYTNIPQKEFFTMQSDNNELNGYIIKPANFSASKKYPVIMWQYSGPGSQEVTNRWHMDWDYYAAQQGFVVICVDGRGTGGRGNAFQDIVYKRLGYYETIDQLNAAKYAATLQFVDSNRIGIAGWSYGGYETLMSVTDTKSQYKAAVAIAPVTSWRYYDTVYTERYMLTPQQNADGYDNGAPTARTKNLNCNLLIMAGTADDNVHLSNTMEFISALQAADKYCDMFLFPNMNHSINGCDARALVYGRMIEYFKTNL